VDLLYTDLHLVLGVDEVSGMSRELVTAICDEEGDGLTLCELVSVSLIRL
jgi:hypothetical protein